jgi:hypothetical protein
MAACLGDRDRGARHSEDMTATLIAPKDVETRLAVSRSPRAELAEREHNGLAVTLFWVRDTSILIVAVAVADSRTGRSFELVLEADDSPLDVFHHPFAYAAARGLEYLDAAPEPEFVDV